MGKKLSLMVFVYLILNGILGFWSMEILIDIFNWNMPLFFEAIVGYIFAIFLAPITVIILIIRMFMGI